MRKKYKMTAAHKAAITQAAARKREQKREFYDKLLEHGVKQKIADAVEAGPQEPAWRAAKIAERAVEELKKGEWTPRNPLELQWTSSQGRTLVFTLAEAKELFFELEWLGWRKGGEE